MRFLVDECTGPAVAGWLRRQGHEVFSVYEEARGMGDEDIIRKALAENWILVTNDKGFGEKVYRERHQHKGVVLLVLLSHLNGHTVVEVLATGRSWLPPVTYPLPSIPRLTSVSGEWVTPTQ